MTDSNVSSETRIDRILLPTDGSDNAVRAANVAIELARKFSAELIVLHVVALPATAVTKASINPAYDADLLEYFKTANENAKKLVDAVVLLAKNKGVKAASMIQKYAISNVEVILDEAAKNNVDLIVIGTRGLTGFKKLLLGSVSSGVVAHAHCSVMVVR